MDSLKPTLEELNFCMRDPRCIRNVCILAHVDHGKTTVSDLLLATNRLVSKRMAGFLRYLDDRPDEQERGITMKSSAVSLLNLVRDEEDKKNKKILLNVIDTPGHIDFSSEVGVAIRVCDGAIILVDLVEGVCVQTRESIKKAFEEKTKMILVLNKFDRLVVELQKDIEEIFQCILHAVEDCNAIIAELYQYEYLDNDVDIEDTGLLFNPDTGNVIFASAIDAWGFTTKQIAALFVDLVKNETVESLNKKLWDFDCYVDSKKEIKTGAIEKKKTNLFIQFCLKTIVQIYETIVIRMEKDKTSVIIERLKISNVTRDMTHNDPKVQVRAILQGWMPLSSTILLQCLKIIPPPCEMDRTKIEYLLNLNRFCENQELNSCIENVIPLFMRSSVEESTPTIAYVSKLFCVNKKNLSQNKPKVFIPKPRDSKVVEVLEKTDEDKDKGKSNNDEPELEENKYIDNEIVMVALARVFTGTLHVNQTIYVMTNSYVPDVKKIDENPKEFLENNKNVVKVVIKELYMLFGRELMLVDSIPAGNFCGIGGLEAHVIRTATLSSILNIVPITERLVTNPVIRHAIEPTNPKELPILHQGLKLLMQSDSCIEVVMQKTGELVILTAGDVHLQKCIEDLRSKFAKTDFHVSSPMVSLRETVSNELSDLNNEVELETAQFVLSVKCVSLPESISSVIINNYDLLQTVEEHQRKSFVDIARQCLDKVTGGIATEKVFKSESMKKRILHIKELLKTAFESAGDHWKDLHQNIWSIVRRNNCVNLLINGTKTYQRSIFLDLTGYDKRALFDHCLVKAFDTLCEAGPLCEEPLTNCAFVVTKFNLRTDVQPQDITSQVTSTLEASIREHFKKTFEKQEQRLVEPMYITDIQVNTNILGKVYTVVNKRHGKVLNAVGMDEQEKTFLVKAQIPVMESEGFANEIRKATSGQANPSLRFSHYEVIDGDPFYEPVEEDDDEEENLNVDSALRANKLRKDIRRRKGLHVDDEVVVHAEKQRTLNKKK